MISNTLANFRRAQTAPQAAKQRGVTLMELIAGLAVMAVIVVGALALFNAANNAQRGTQLTQDVTALRGAVTHLWMGQGGYGTGQLAPTLLAAGRVPGTLRNVSGTLHHQTGIIDILGAGQWYHVVVTGLTQAVCIDLLTGASGWIGVRTATAYTPGTALATTEISTFPISPAVATGRCGGAGNSNVVQFTGS